NYRINIPGLQLYLRSTPQTKIPTILHQVRTQQRFGSPIKEVTVHIAQIVDGGVCVAASDGHKVHKVIYLEINKNNRVKISFSGVTRLTTAFLNAAVGQLYGEFSEETIRRHLAPPVDAEAWHLKRLKLVVDRAKVFFRDPEGETGLQFPVRR